MNPCLVTTVDEWYGNNCSQTTVNEPQSFYNDLFNNFYQGTDSIWIPGISGSKDELEFQDLLVDFCNRGSVGGKCREPLLNRCQRFNRDDAGNPTVRKVCGCYLPDNQYLSGIPRQCDTICSGFDTAKFFPSSTATSPAQCDESVCVIDNVTIEAKGSSVGDITFDQICPGCGATGCRCVISDINIVARDSQLGRLNIEQNCTQTQCFAQSPGQARMEVDCQDFVKGFGLDVSTIQRERDKTIAFIVGFSIVAFFLFVLFFFALYTIIRTPPPVKREVMSKTVYIGQSKPPRSP